MHCFVPSPLSIKQSSAASKHHCHRRRRNKRRHHGSTRNNNEDDNQSSSCSQSSSSSSSSSSCCCCGRRSCGSSVMSACSSATSLSSCTSASTLASTASMAAGTTTTTTVPTTTTKTTNTTHNVTTVRPKKRVHFAPDASLEQVHVVRNMRKFKFPQWLWWQRGELPSENEIVAQLLGLHPYSSTTTTTTTTTLTNWNLLSSPHDRARRLAHATLDLLAAHAKRGGGRHSLQRQAAAERHFQATLAAAAPWRGLESLIVSTTGLQAHVGAVVLAAQQQQQQPHTQEPQPLWQVARQTSRPAAQLAIQRARFDAQQVDNKTTYYYW